MVCTRMEGGQPSGISTREGTLALITIPFLSVILKNYQEIIEKGFQKGQLFDAKCRPQGGEIVLFKTEKTKFKYNTVQYFFQDFDIV